MFGFILTVHIIICLLIIVLVLLNSSKGAEMGAAFGGIGQVNSIRTPESLLGKITTGLAIMFMITSLLLVFVTKTETDSSVIQDAIIEQQSSNTNQ